MRRTVVSRKVKLLLLYASVSGTAKSFAFQVLSLLSRNHHNISFQLMVCAGQALSFRSSLSCASLCDGMPYDCYSTICHMTAIVLSAI